MDVPHGFFLFFKKKLKFKPLKAQNKCICFCLNLPSRSHIDPSNFRKINWLPVSDRVEPCIANTVIKYWKGIVLGHIHKMFQTSLCRYSTISQMELEVPLRETKLGQKMLSFLKTKNMVQNRP